MVLFERFLRQLLWRRELLGEFCLSGVENVYANSPTGKLATNSRGVEATPRIPNNRVGARITCT